MRIDREVAHIGKKHKDGAQSPEVQVYGVINGTNGKSGSLKMAKPPFPGVDDGKIPRVKPVKGDCPLLPQTG